MKAHKVIISILIALYGILWIGGIISYLFLGKPPSDARWTAPVFLCLAGLLAIALSAPGVRLPLLAGGLLGLGIEIVGVRLGFPFGGYTYTRALEPFVLGVPCAIGFAWLILFAYVKQMLQLGGIRSPWLQLCGASWMLALDLLIDPLASGPLGYWIWEKNGWYYGVPLANFAGWFGVSLALFSIFHIPWPTHMGIIWIGLSIVIFFSLIALAQGILGPLLVGLFLCLLNGWVVWKSRSQTADDLKAFFNKIR